MEVAKVSSYSSPAAPVATPSRPPQPAIVHDSWELPSRPAGIPQAEPPKPKRNWHGEAQGAWYITKLMALSAVSSTLAAVSEGWDCLRAKFSRGGAN